ncbi:unnamed protein product [Lota lota]
MQDRIAAGPRRSGPGPLWTGAALGRGRSGPGPLWAGAALDRGRSVWSTSFVSRAWAAMLEQLTLSKYSDILAPRRRRSLSKNVLTSSSRSSVLKRGRGKSTTTSKQALPCWFSTSTTA